MIEVPTDDGSMVVKTNYDSVSNVDRGDAVFIDLDPEDWGNQDTFTAISIESAILVRDELTKIIDLYEEAAKTPYKVGDHVKVTYPMSDVWNGPARVVAVHSYASVVDGPAVSVRMDKDVGVGLFKLADVEPYTEPTTLEKLSAFKIGTVVRTIHSPSEYLKVSEQRYINPVNEALVRDVDFTGTKLASATLGGEDVLV